MSIGSNKKRQFFFRNYLKHHLSITKLSLFFNFEKKKIFILACVSSFTVINSRMINYFEKFCYLALHSCLLHILKYKEVGNRLFFILRCSPISAISYGAILSVKPFTKPSHQSQPLQPRQIPI